jgi:hypothetical protein
MKKITFNLSYILLSGVTLSIAFPKIGFSQSPKQKVYTASTIGFNFQSMAQNPVEILGAIGSEIPYIVKCKASQKVFDIHGTSLLSKKPVWQYDFAATNDQRFFIEKHENYFYIRTFTDNFYLTADTSKYPSVLQKSFYKPDLFSTNKNDNQIGKGKNDSTKYFVQQWKIEKTSETFCFIITNRAYPYLAIQTIGISSGTYISLKPKTGDDLQKWLLKFIPFEDNPNSADANFALDTKCDLFVSFLGQGTTLELQKIFPEWRPVGETNVPNGTSTPFNNSLRTLEGEIVSGISDVSWGDLPISHFTHDFNFTVKPDPAFAYLIAKNAQQNNIEVEWECGIAQGNDVDKNPAQSLNRKGDSYGFFTAGHQRRDVIWNWPTNKDWVHVEGQWIWDRGHPPASTEIHPPQFIGIKRYLPVKYTDNLLAGTFVYATRCDVFANGDGDIMWNNKGHNDFAQKVKISAKSYTVIFTQDLPKPSSSSVLKYGEKIQKGDTYRTRPVITVYQNGTADNPKPHVVFELPASNESGNAVFARSYYLYWDDVFKHGIPATYAIKTLRVNIDSVEALTNMDGSGESGEFRLFANIGSNWFFLNEFANVDDILSHGIGEVSRTIWAPDHYIFRFNLEQEIYVPVDKEFRMAVSGWEADYIDNKYGNIVNPYLSCQVAKSTLDNLFSAYQYNNGGGADDPLGVAEKVIKFNNPILPYYRVNSKGDIDDTDKDNGSGITDPNNSFRAVFKVIKL